ncbi:hypothetical protein QCE63_32540 [Caballeronia sp. LZ065]|uniref:hypothetical protein n=1 Tax=Caballeronia sp. LZ065 TaxID=3038571 RepID=UPI00285813B1|nr:hypothetical protein [Caballeronia sp. LZ065]MDR5784152.1 hypothetical protein [Caballeronia sp. LZ065]
MWRAADRIGEEYAQGEPMGARFSFRHRLKQCPRCRRPVGADVPVCPHCDFHRLPERAFVPRLPAPANLPHASRVVRAARRRTPLRAVLVLVMALLAISGYISLREAGIETRLKSLSSHHWLGFVDEQPNHAPENEAASSAPVPIGSLNFKEARSTRV